MKKSLLIITVFLLAWNTSFSEVQFGVGFLSSTKAKIDYKGDKSVNLGFHSRILIGQPRNFFFTGGYTYYLPCKYNTKGTNVILNDMAANADINYNFVDNGEIRLYCLGGMNMDISQLKSRDDDTKVDDKNAMYDIELGVGIRIERGFAEIKYDNNKAQMQVFIALYI